MFGDISNSEYADVMIYMTSWSVDTVKQVCFRRLRKEVSVGAIEKSLAFMISVKDGREHVQVYKIHRLGNWSEVNNYKPV